MRRKMLFLGIDTSTHDAIRIAKELGIYTIVTDYNTPEARPEKAEADEYWMINVADMDVLYERCLAEHVDGVFAGNHEFCLDKAKELCARLDLPFYATDDGWRCARDKGYFKELCARCGLEVPRTYMTEGCLESIDPGTITYPAIVKPSDSCARQGLSICGNSDELAAAYDYALSASGNGRVIIEEYVEGDEIAADFMVVDGEPYITSFNFLVPIQIGDESVFVIALQKSRYRDDFVGKCMPEVRRLIKELGWKNGPCFLQAIVRDGRYFFLEFGGRLTGIGAWSHQEHYYHMSILRLALMMAAGMPVDGNDAELLGRNIQYSMIYMPWLKKGRIADICGLDTVKGMHGVEIVLERYRAGDEVDTSGSMFGMAYYIVIAADSLDDLCGKLRDINTRLSIRSNDGTEMLIKYEDYDKIRSYYG